MSKKRLRRIIDSPLCAANLLIYNLITNSFLAFFCKSRVAQRKFLPEFSFDRDPALSQCSNLSDLADSLFSLRLKSLRNLSLSVSIFLSILSTRTNRMQEHAITHLSGVLFSTETRKCLEYAARRKSRFFL